MILYLTHGNGEESIPLKLPASSSQVEEIDIRLDDICSGEGNFRISDAKSSVKGLWQFIRSADLLDPEDLEKLNRLSRQLDAMSEKERQIFAGALLSECINSLDDVLQTAGRIGQYEIITEVTCDRELGGYLVEHGKIDCPEHLKPYLDYVGIGAEFYSNCGGAYTLDGYVVQKEHLPRYSQAPEPWRNENRDEILRMTLRVEGKPDYTLVLPADEEYLDAVKDYLDIDGKPDYTLVLPADEEYLDAVKAYLDIDVFADALLCDIRFKVPYIGELIRDTDCPAVEDYNDFAEALEDIWQKDGMLLTYAAVLDAERPDTLRGACELLRNLDNYQRIVEGAYGYGQQRLQETLGLDDEAIYELDGYMDFEQYGQDCMENDCVTKTEFGLLRRLDPPFPEQTQGQQMFR